MLIINYKNENKRFDAVLVLMCFDCKLVSSVKCLKINKYFSHHYQTIVTAGVCF